LAHNESMIKGHAFGLLLTTEGVPPTPLYPRGV